MPITGYQGCMARVMVEVVNIQIACSAKANLGQILSGYDKTLCVNDCVKCRRIEALFGYFLSSKIH